MKRKQGILSVAFILSCLLTVGTAGQPNQSKFKFACLLFDHKPNEVAFEDRIDAEKYKKWFKTDYSVGGERIETPSSASSFGVLILTDGDEILAMPLYTWGNGESRYFACQSREIGTAPLFCVSGHSRKEFLDKLRQELGKIATLQSAQ